jgi:hypothetical protein
MEGALLTPPIFSAAASNPFASTSLRSRVAAEISSQVTIPVHPVWPAALFVAQEDLAEASRQFVRDFPERHLAARAGRTFVSVHHRSTSTSS